MELKDAKKIAIDLQRWLWKSLYNDRDKALIVFNNRITELETEMKQVLKEFDEVEKQRDDLLEICRTAEKTAIEIHSGRRHEGSMPCGILADRLNRIIGEIDKKQ